MQDPLRHFPELSRSKQGFTLTELAIVLGVIGTILGAIWAAASMAYQNNSALKAQQQIATIVHNIRALYATHPYFLKIATYNASADLGNAGVFPPEMLIPGGADYATFYSPAVNAWQGPTVVWESIGGNTKAFRLAYYGVNASTCSQIASGVIGTYSSDGPQNLIVACNNTSQDLNPNDANGAQLDAVGISRVCQVNTTSNCQSVEFDYNL